MSRKQSARMTDSVFRYLSDGISEGRWKSGEKLPSETQLCRELGTSRTTVRGAIGRLNGLGLAQSIQGKGTFVCAAPAQIPEPFSIQGANRLDVFEFRKIIESESAALAAIRATAQDVREMEKAVADMALGQTQQEVAEQDLIFHYLIARASGNEIIQNVFEAMRDTYRQMFMTNVAQMHNAGAVYHRRILMAIQTRDMDGARKCMLDHLEDTMRQVCRP